MREQLVKEEIGALAQAPGVQACALVESGSGLILYATGAQPGKQSMWEAAIDYWRLHRRINEHFTELGELHAAVLHHRHAMLVLLPCAADSELLVVCVAAHHRVDWREWQRSVRALGLRLRNL